MKSCLTNYLHFLVRQGAWLAPLLALLLLVPTFGTGSFADDYVQRAALQAAPTSATVMNLYTFADPNGPSVASIVGVQADWPWWADPQLQLKFFRPLAGGLMALDHWAFGSESWGPNLHSALWYVALVIVVGMVFRRAFASSLTAGAAQLLFAINGHHAMPAIWAAHRYAVVAAVLSLLGLVAHLEFRQRGWSPGRWLGVLGIALGLFAGEVALCVVFYLLAYEVAIALDIEANSKSTRDGSSLQWQGAAPVALLTAAYLTFYFSFGYGAAHSGIYLDPLRAPGHTIASLLRRIPAFLGDFVWSVPAELSFMLPGSLFVALGIAGAGAVTLLFCSLGVEHWGENNRRALGWLVPGALVSLLPLAMALPGSRLLLLPDLGGAALLAVLMQYGFARRGGGRLVLVLRRSMVALLVVVNVGIAPTLFQLNANNMRQLSEKVETIVREAPVSPQTEFVVVIAASDPTVAMSVPFLSGLKESNQARWTVLSMSRGDHTVTCTGPKNFRLTSLSKPFVAAGFAQLVRSPEFSFEEGQPFPFPGGHLTVHELVDGLPMQLEVTLNRQLDDPRLTLLAWQEGKLVEFALPPLGESKRLLWTPGPTGLL